MYAKGAKGDGTLITRIELIFADFYRADSCSFSGVGWKLEFGSWKLEIGSLRLQVGSWRLEVGGLTLDGVRRVIKVGRSDL